MVAVLKTGSLSDFQNAHGHDAPGQLQLWFLSAGINLFSLDPRFCDRQTGACAHTRTIQIPLLPTTTVHSSLLSPKGEITEVCCEPWKPSFLVRVAGALGSKSFALVTEPLHCWWQNMLTNMLSLEAWRMAHLLTSQIPITTESSIPSLKICQGPLDSVQITLHRLNTYPYFYGYMYIKTCG